MKFYITKFTNTTLLYKAVKRFGYEVDLIENYDGNLGYFIISSNEVRHEDKYWTQFIHHKNLIFLLDDAIEAYASSERPEYVYFYSKLDEFGIHRSRGIICYNNAYQNSQGVIQYKTPNFNMLYSPIFALCTFDNWMDLNESYPPPKYDYSYFVRNGKPHKKECYFKIKEKNLENIILTYKFNKDFEDSNILDDVEDDLIDEFGFHLKPSVYYSSKVNIVVETEYYPYKDTLPDRFEEILHLSEKTWRSISFGLPFVLISSKNSLKEIKRLGFKTFESLIDESYDSMDDSVRMDFAINAATELLKYHGTDELNDIIQYNKSLIYDNDKMGNLFENEFIKPLKKYSNNLVI